MAPLSSNGSVTVAPTSSGAWSLSVMDIDSSHATVASAWMSPAGRRTMAQPLLSGSVMAVQTRHFLCASGSCTGTHAGEKAKARQHECGCAGSSGGREEFGHDGQMAALSSPPGITSTYISI